MFFPFPMKRINGLEPAQFVRQCAVAVFLTGFPLGCDEFSTAVPVQVEGIDNLVDAGNIPSLPGRVLVPPTAAEHISKTITIHIDRHDVGSRVWLLPVQKAVLEGEGGRD